MTNLNIKHFKLTNNDEIVCEVLDWNCLLYTSDAADE